MNKQQLIDNLANAKLAKKSAWKNYRLAKKTYRSAKKALKLYRESEKNMKQMKAKADFVNDMLKQLESESK